MKFFLSKTTKLKNKFGKDLKKQSILNEDIILDESEE